jgi:hypothetical protein
MLLWAAFASVLDIITALIARQPAQTHQRAARRRHPRTRTSPSVF